MKPIPRSAAIIAEKIKALMGKDKSTQEKSFCVNTDTSDEATGLPEDPGFDTPSSITGKGQGRAL